MKVVQTSSETKKRPNPPKIVEFVANPIQTEDDASHVPSSFLTCPAYAHLPRTLQKRLNKWVLHVNGLDYCHDIVKDICAHKDDSTLQLKLESALPPANAMFASDYESIPKYGRQNSWVFVQGVNFDKYKSIMDPRLFWWQTIDNAYTLGAIIPFSELVNSGDVGKFPYRFF